MNMTTTILAVVGALFLANTTWIYYVAIMRLKAQRATLRPAAKGMAYAGLLVGYPLDVLVNLLFSLAVLDLPREVTLSAHLSRLNDDDNWRGAAARWVCAELLDPFDPSGKHCN